MDTAGAVLKFLRSVGSTADAEYYLREFRAGPREQFAAIAVDASTLVDALDAVSLDLRFLSELGLTPVVVLGLDPDGEAGPGTAALHRALGEMDVAADVLAATDSAGVRAAARAGTIPIVDLGAHAAFDATGVGTAPGPATRHTLDTLDTLGQLLTDLGTPKLILLRSQGGLRRGGQRISVVNLSDELTALRAEGVLTADERRMLDRAETLVFQRVPHRLLIAITSPINLLHELFTLRGAGTLLRPGSTILRSDGLAGVDTARLGTLLSASFGRTPAPALWQRPFSHAYVEREYRGAALLQAHPQWGYLSKFAVTRRAQGEGIGRDLWQAVKRDYPRLLWRSRAGNPINPWYEGRCDGRMRVGPWTVYFRGLSPADLPSAIAYATGQPDDLPQPIG